MARIFISYSHVDEKYRNELEKHLAPMRRDGLVEVWHDRRIPPGDDFAHAIAEELEAADVVLLLISADFLNSDYCHDVEMKRVLERDKEGSARVIPIILRPCDWHHSPFSDLLAVPTNGKPISKHADLDDAYLDIVQKLRTVLGAATHKASSPSRSPIATGTAEAVSGERPRSGNLRVTKSFSDYEKDSYRTETFEFIANYFENSISELELRNSELECLFRRVDADTFTAAVYSGGEHKTGCRISLASSFGEIAYSVGEGSSPGSMNEWLTVEHDGHMPFLKPGGLMMGREADLQLTQEGAAEYFWSILMEPLQR